MDEGFPITNASRSFRFAKTRVHKKHLQVYQTMIAPPQRGFRVIAHINLTLDVCAQTEKESGLRIS